MSSTATAPLPGRASRPRASTLLLVILLAACGGDPPAGDGGGPELPPPRTYTVRGEVIRIADDGSTLFLRHEPIPDFVDITGRTSGMDSMVMPFALAPGSAPAGVAAGDAVEVVLEVDWAADVPARLTAVQELPAGTELELGPKEEP